MTEKNSFWRDRNTIVVGLLVLAVAIVVGAIVGLSLSNQTSDGVTATTLAIEPANGVTPSTTTTTISTTTTSSTQPPPQDSLEFVATTDTYVDADAPDELLGLESTLVVENDSPEIRQALIRFEVAGIPEGEIVSQAVLRLTVERESNAMVDVRLVSGAWDSNTTWSNAPQEGAVVGTIQPGTVEGGIVEVVVTQAVSGNGVVDLYLTTESDDSSEFASVESGDSAPVLAVAWGDTQLLAQPGGSDAETDTADSTTSTVLPLEASTGTVRLEGESADLIGAGDIADCDNDGALITADLVLEVLREEPDATVFTTGDNVYESGTPEEFANCFNPTWGQFKERIRPSIGNHDAATLDAAGYYAYFGDAAGEPGEGYYSFAAGAWLIVVLNTVCESAGGCEPGSDQEMWLRGVLAETDARCVAAIYHHPVFSSGEHGGEDQAETLFQVLYEEGADLVLNGHDHNYERFAPQDPEGQSDLVRGIREFVVGTGGKGLDPIPDNEPNSEVRSNEALGVLHLKLFEAGYEWEFLAEPGSTFTDSGKDACH